MNTEKITFKGKVQWAKVPPATPDFGYEPEPGSLDCFYRIDIECDQKRLDELKKRYSLPSLTSLKTDQEGNTYIRVKSTKVRGDYNFPPPVVVDINGNPIEVKIANGSEAIVSVDVRPIKGRKGHALQLKTVLVTKLIPFNDGGGDDFKDLLAQVNPNELEEGYAQDLNPEPDVSTTDDW